MPYVFQTLKTRTNGSVLFVAFDFPPINLVGPEIVGDLIALLDELERDAAVAVVVFSSANEEFFLPHVDMTRVPEYTARTREIPGSASGSLGGLLRRLSEIRQVTIAQVAGFARGAGSELALACDMRFAARGKAVFCQNEAGFGALPGAGAMQHLTRLVGRGRAMEVLLSSGDYDAETAERYGWINRALPPEELGAFVEALALRIAAFPPEGVTLIKRRVNDICLPPLADVRTDAALFQATVHSPRVQARTKELFDAGLQTAGELERSLAAGLDRLKG